jgi:hypothetical protein
MFIKLTLDELNERHKQGTLLGVFQVSHEDYHAGPGISRSQLSQILQCPAVYKYSKENPQEPTVDMRFGSAVHCRLLEPEDFQRRYVKAPEGRRGTNAYKEFEALNQGKEILTDEEWTKIEAIADKIEKTEVAVKLVSGIREIAFYWKDEATGILCKCKPDVLNDIGVVDLKTSSYVDKESFAKDIANMNYHIQAPFYLDGIRAALSHCPELKIPPPLMFSFLVIGKKEPFLLAAYLLGPESMAIGRQLYQKALWTLLDCQRNNHYPEYLDPKADEILSEIEIPIWARRNR